MPENEPISPVGAEPLPKLGRSLPSYHGPREEEADKALNHTSFSPGVRATLIALFLLTILAVPLLQIAVEYRQMHSFRKLPLLEIFKVIPTAEKIKTARGIHDVNNLLPKPEEIKAAEKAVENESVVSQWLLPRVQSVLTGALQAGNEQVITGRNGWLFYRADVEYVTGTPFLDPARMKERARTAGVQPDPVRAIVDFRDQLAQRGIELVVLPIPVKPCIHGEMLSERSEGNSALQNPSFGVFIDLLKKEKVRVFDPESLLMERKASGPLYLQTDTHWRPETMECVADELAKSLGLPPAAKRQNDQVLSQDVAAVGDIAAMLKLPPDQTIFNPEKATLHQVISGNMTWRQSRDARILLLGDSFCNIYSLGAMGWGEFAGFAEHLSRALGEPLDCILRNSDASFATREILSREMRAGRDRLAGKKLVIWEFAERELASGNWKLLDISLGEPHAATFFVPKPGETARVTGVVEAISPVPRPRSVPYKDHILMLHLVDITPASNQKSGGSMQSVVYLWSMRDNVWTKAARLRPGDKVEMQLRAWSDVAPEYEKINRTELDDAALSLEEQAWGEIQ